jgi:nucleoside-diphosphate-sugar epimerase
MKKTTVLLTGNSGYIGTVMTRRLKEEAFSVVGFDSGWFSRNCLFPVSALEMPDKQLVKDIRDVSEKDLEGIDAVMHLAGLSNDPLGELNPMVTHEINCAATAKLGSICRSLGIDRFIFASSCSIYGIAGDDAPLTEEAAVNPITAYAKAKVDSEAVLRHMADRNFHPVFLRNATVYGVSPRMRLDLVVNNLLAWAYLTGEVNIMSDGMPWRPIVHIEDFCSAFIAALKAPVEKIHGEAFNVGINEENYRVMDIASEIRKALPDSRVRILNKTGPDERTYRVDFSKIRRCLPAFNPEWRLGKGVTELLSAYRKHDLTLNDFESDKYFRIRTIKALINANKINRDLEKTG